jgi:beta-galactosidase
VRLPEPEGKKIIAIGWATYPTLPKWNWPGQEGKELQVEVYSGAERVQLYLNDKLIGEKPTSREQEFKALFSVPYAPGTLKAVGLRGGHAVAESVLTTTGPATRLQLKTDRSSPLANGQDLSFIEVQAVDAEGRPDFDADNDVQFSISGPGVIAAVGNGDGQDPDSYQGNHRKLYQGRALVVVRTAQQAGTISVTAKAAGLSDGSISLNPTFVPAAPTLK